MIRRPAAVPVHFTCYDLLPQAGLVLWSDAPADLVWHFAGRFREVWSSLPGGAVRCLLGGWYRGSGPLIALAMHLRQPPTGRQLAFCQDGGHTLAFSAFAVEEKTDAELQALIAHELAHAARAFAGPERLQEEDADLLAAAWGFAEGIRQLRRR